MSQPRSKPTAPSAAPASPPVCVREWIQALALLGLAALAVILPLLLAGPSCGHDFTFHLGSWMDAAAQLHRHAALPRWAYSPAWNAGEPRFVFYPPLSWLLGAELVGACLKLALPLAAAPIVFTWIALTASGLGLYRLARDFATAAPALIASTLYLAGPYALFTAFERTAYGELLAAAWLPLLLRTALQSSPSPASVAIPLALLWLTNAPAAVMGTYAFALIVVFRTLADTLRARRSGALPAQSALPARPSALSVPWSYPLRCTLGAALGFCLAAFYLLPAAYERRWVEISMAVIPNMRPEDNFLFGHTGDGPHDAVLHTASLLAVSLLLVTCAAFTLVWRQKAPTAGPGTRRLSAPFAVLTLATGLLLTPASRLFWQHLPELSFLQFPWRLLAVLSVVTASLLAAMITSAFGRFRLHSPWLSVGVCLPLAILAGFLGNRSFRQGCERDDRPARLFTLFSTGHGAPPTDEYTPGDADNDVLRSDDPPFWLGESAAAFAPGTTPNPAATLANYDVSPPEAKTLAGRAPSHLDLHLPVPAFLVLNLRAYPAWRVWRDGVPLATIARDDGLLAVHLPAGDSSVDLRWRRTPDVLAGDALSVLALGASIAAHRTSRRSRKLQRPSDAN